MKTTFKILGGVVVLAIVAVVGWHYYQLRRARQAGLLTENITHDGDLWKADFTARIPPPSRPSSTPSKMSKYAQRSGQGSARRLAKRQ